MAADPRATPTEALSAEGWAERNFLRVHQKPSTLQDSRQYLIQRGREPAVRAAERERKERLRRGTLPSDEEAQGG